MKLSLIKSIYCICVLFLLFSLGGTTFKNHFLSDTDCVYFQAKIETEKNANQKKYYKVLVSCKRMDEYNLNKTKQVIFRDQYLFSTYMLEDIFELISEAEQKCKCIDDDTGK